MTDVHVHAHVGSKLCPAAPARRALVGGTAHPLLTPLCAYRRGMRKATYKEVTAPLPAAPSTLAHWGCHLSFVASDQRRALSGTASHSGEGNSSAGPARSARDRSTVPRKHAPQKTCAGSVRCKIDPRSTGNMACPSAGRMLDRPNGKCPPNGCAALGARACPMPW